MTTSSIAVLIIAVAMAAPAWAQESVGEPMQRKATEASADRLLDDALLSSPEKRAEAQALLGQAPPTTGDRDEMGAAHYKRGLAALQLGRQSQVVSEMGKAAELLSHPGERSDAHYYQGQAMLNIGQWAKAIPVLQAANRDEQAPSSVMRNLALIAEQYGKLGNMEGASATLKDCQAQSGRMVSMQAETRNPTFSTWRRVNLMRCEIALHAAQGQVAEIEPLMRKVIAAYEDAPNTRNTYVVGNRYQQLAENLRAQDKLAEAENEARTALAIFQRTVGPASQRTGAALQALGRIIAEQGRVKDGEALARKGLDVIQAAGLNGNGTPRVIIADILAMDYRWKDAREQFEMVRKANADDPETFEGIARRDPNYPLALLKTGSPDQALGYFNSSYDTLRAKLGDGAYATAQARGLMGAALAALGRGGEALAHFQAAVPVLTAQDDEEDQETGNRARDQKLRLILESYMDLLTSSRGVAQAAGIDPVAESFRLADGARGRSVQRALAASATRAAADNPAVAHMARRAQDVEKQMAALSGLLANAISARAEDQDGDAIEGLKKRIAALRAERADTMKQIAAKFPDYARMLNPQPFTVADVQAKLRPAEAMLAFYSAEERLYAWAIPASGAAGFASAPLGRIDLEAKVKHLRDALDLSVSGIDEIPDFDLKTASDIYTAVIAPTEAAWTQAETLFTVPHGPLGQLPLALLPTRPVVAAAVKTAAKPAAGPLFAKYRDVPWLARKAAIAQLPSVGALVTLRALPERHTPRRSFIAFGDPLFSKEQALEAAGDGSALATRGVKRRSAPKPNPDFTSDLGQLPRLPDTAEEVKSIAAVLGAEPDQDLFLQARASEAMVRKTDLSKWRVVMFATHGLVPGDLTGLDQPALALTSPEVSGDGSSGVLTMERIMGLKLDADWVVLSACNTAAGEGSGAEAVSGLGRAFFYAGARALLVSNWPVETISARLLTTDLFRRQAADPQLSRAQAMRKAMLGLMDGPGPLDGAGKEQFVYAHPTFWAPFSLVGDGG
ncbi:CHAT domain-containing protein [Paramagnetospirillum kuznetsovii]|nr:CHAT domain-containing tetratricopeptide repeat protein [Paramagnetospirillum kuznetsovii]